MRPILILAVFAALAVPTSALAHPHGAGKARQACKAERESMGKDAFKAKYANDRGRRGMRRCMRERVKAARATCREERAADKAAFREKYSNDRGRRAMRRCVRTHSGA